MKREGVLLATALVALLVSVYLFNSNSNISYSSKDQAIKVPDDASPATETVTKDAPQPTLPSADSDVIETCHHHIAEASRLIKQKRELEKAFVALSLCGDLSPTDHSVQYQLGQLFVVLGHADLGAAWLLLAVEQQPTNFEYIQYFMAVAKKEGDHTNAIRVGERFLEETLGLEHATWQSTLLDLSLKPREELQWLMDAGIEVLRVLESLHKHYSAAVWLPATNAGFHLLSTMKPGDSGLVQSFSDFSASVGLFNQSLQLLMDNLEYQYGRQYPYVDAKEPVLDHSLVLLASSLDGFIINMARSLLVADHQDVLALISSICALTEDASASIDIHRFLSSQYVSLSDATEIVQQCLRNQGVIASLMRNSDNIMSEDVVSDFGYSALHAFASAGMTAIVSQLIELNMKPGIQNSLGQTAFHSAILRGQSKSAEVLWKALSPEIRNQKDRFGRTPWMMVCAHGWASIDFIFDGDQGAADGGAQPSCLPQPFARYHIDWVKALEERRRRDQKPSVSVGGGWRTSRDYAELQASCDIDVVDGAQFSVNDFLVDYLSLHRPVLVKDGLRGAHWDNVRKRWTRQAFERRYGGLVFERAEVPYAAAFGLEANLTTVKDFLTYMDAHHESVIDGLEEVDTPGYIFSSFSHQAHAATADGDVSAGEDGVSMPGEGLLHTDFRIPGAIGPGVSEIATRTRQFYLGPVGSGAPMHVHSAAWNALVYGRKRWFMVPPALAFYSAEHPQDFISDVLPSLRRSGSVLECVQESGDVMFVPEMWSHAVINEAESIGFASEFAWGQGIFSLPAPAGEDE